MSGDACVRVNVQGVGVDVLDLDGAVGRLLAQVRAGRGGYVCFAGVHAVGVAQEEAAFREVLHGAMLVCADGMPLVWWGRWVAGARGLGRVYGPEVLLRVCEESVGWGLSHFFYGGEEGVAPALAAALEDRFPGLRVVGAESPGNVGVADAAALRQRLQEVRPDFVWLGLGSPKQDWFAAALSPGLDGVVVLGVGAAFDFLSGRKAQAPRWMRRLGLEWGFRLLCEPRRLWRRYARYVPLFVGRALLQALGWRRPEWR